MHGTQCSGPHSKGHTMTMTLINDLPPVLKALARDAFPKARKVLVIAPRQFAEPIRGGSIVKMHGEGNSVSQVPYEKGGGYCTTAAMYAVKDFGGFGCIFVVRTAAMEKLNPRDMADLTVMTDMHLEVIS